MSAPDIKDAIATREYDLKDGRKVTIYLWAPVVQPTGEYGCSYKLTGIGTEKIRMSYGVDSMQALTLALNTTLSHLCASKEYEDGHLTWLGSLNLGLPVPKYMRDDIPED